MTEAAIYLATAPKSNTALTTYAAAKADVDAHGALPVPAHLRNASSGMAKALGWGAAYQYPHDFKGHYVREEYLPEQIRGHHYYKPSESGDEREIAARLARLGEPEKKK
jgi:putative ATPase